MKTSVKKTTKKAPARKERAVLVTTTHKGVFFGYATQTSGDVINLKRARMAIYWGTTKGLMQLCHTGPTASSKVSAPADIELRGITAVFEIAPEALAVWEGTK